MHAQESWLHNLQLKKMSKFRGEQLLLFSLSVLTFCNRMNCRTPGFPAPHYLPEFTQTHVHWANGAVQSSHPLSSPSPPALDLSQHQSLFQWVSFFASHGQITGVSASASVLSMNSQSWFPLGLTGLITLLSKGLSRVFSSITVWKHQFFSAQPSLWCRCHIRPWLLEKW